VVRVPFLLSPHIKWSWDWLHCTSWAYFGWFWLGLAGMLKLRWFFIIPWFDMIWLGFELGSAMLGWLGLADAITVFLCGLCCINAPSKSYGHNRKENNLLMVYVYAYNLKEIS
jgi:hypothetical protein